MCLNPVGTVTHKTRDVNTLYEHKIIIMLNNSAPWELTRGPTYEYTVRLTVPDLPSGNTVGL